MRKWWPLVTVCLGTLMLLVDVTIVNVALPQMALALDTSFTALQWVVDGYALSLAVLLLGAGALGDRYGHRRLYLGGLAIFALASLVCGVATGAEMLIAARFVQGVGAAAMFTTTFALLNSAYQGRERGVAYGVWGGVSGAAAAIGPILGGVLTDGLSWRWIFLVNLPVSVAAVVLCCTVLAADRGTEAGRFDLAGTATFTVAAAALTLAVIRANTEGWGAVQTWGLLVLSVLGLAAFVLVERRSPHPMLDLALLRNRSFAGILVGSLLVNVAAFAAFTYTSIWLQSLMGLTSLQAGLVGIPMSLVSIVVSGVAGARLHGRSRRAIIGGGLLVIGAGSALTAVLLGPDSSWPALIPGYCVIGLGVGLVMPTLAEAAMGAVPPQRAGMAAGAVNTARQLGFAIGIAVLGAVFIARSGARLSGYGVPDAERAAHGLAAGQAGRMAALGRDVLRSAAVSGLDAVFLSAAVAGVAGGVAVLLLVRPARKPSPDRAPEYVTVDQ